MLTALHLLRDLAPFIPGISSDFAISLWALYSNHEISKNTVKVRNFNQMSFSSLEPV